MQEVRARGGELYVLADADTRIAASDGVHVIRLPEHYGAAVADPARGAAAAARLPHGARARHRRRQAAEPGEVGHGGVAAMRYDAIVVGAGHNGLVCACYLAKAGLKVKVVERRGVVGGAAVTEEFHPGFRNSVAAYTVSLLQAKVIRELRLAEHGLRIVERPLSNFLPLAERLPEGWRRAGGHAARIRPVLGARREEPANRTGPSWSGSPTCCARWRSRRRPTPAAARAISFGFFLLQCRLKRARHGSTSRPAGPVHAQRGGLARGLVRVGAGQGGVRLRRGGRRLRQPVSPRHRLRAAAPLLRRGERQARHLGPRHRRHGRDQRGARRRGAPARRGDRVQCPGSTGFPRKYCS